MSQAFKMDLVVIYKKGKKQVKISQFNHAAESEFTVNVGSQWPT
jgi:hypothetical protein